MINTHGRSVGITFFGNSPSRVLIQYSASREEANFDKNDDNISKI